MSVRVTADIPGLGLFTSALDRMVPSADSDVMDGIRKSALLIQRIAAQETIVRGRGKKAKPLPDRLSGRTGALAGSIGIDDRLPKEIAVGTRLAYGAVHEFGGTFSVQRKKSSYAVVYPRRPFLQPAVEIAGVQVEAIIVRSWSDSL